MATQHGIARLQSSVVTRLKESTVKISTFLDRVDPGNALQEKAPADKSSIAMFIDVGTDPITDVILESGTESDDVNNSDSSSGNDIENDSEIEVDGAPYLCKMEEAEDQNSKFVFRLSLSYSCIMHHVSYVSNSVMH